MKKLIYLGFLTLLIGLILNCAGPPESLSSNEPYESFILNNNFQIAEYQKIDSQIPGLVGAWQADDDSRNLYSILQFDDNDNFIERVHNQLTHETVASYEGEYNINVDVLEIKVEQGSVYQFFFNLDANKLQLSAK